MALVETATQESIGQTMLAEFETQVPITRKYLERLPADKLTWTPHEKSMTAGQLALHLALVPGSVIRLVQSNPASAPGSFRFPQPASREEILNAFDESVRVVCDLLPNFDESYMRETWRLNSDGREVFAQRRAGFLRDIMLNHWYQHRGQFSVYLRLLGIAVPASWGPSADEPLSVARN
jgi:uncharacterized damage-inducible protein DinB